VARPPELAQDEIEITRGEKLLAVVLAAFVFVGLIWGYDKLDLADGPYDTTQLTQAEQAAVDRASDAQGRLGQAREARARALEELELSREAYRTALDAGRPAAALEREYRAAEERYAAAGRAVERAEAAVRASTPAAEASQRRAAERADDERRADERWTFVLRLGYTLLALALAYGLLLAARGTRWMTVALACVGAAALLALVMAIDYLEEYVDWQDAGPLALSLAGIALTLAALWSLQRYLRRRIPLRRVRKGECPFCGFPVRANTRCEGCGREVVAPCSTCGEPRRVGVAHCGSCGTA
jgi:hypothetical protein